MENGIWNEAAYRDFSSSTFLSPDLEISLFIGPDEIYKVSYQ